MSSCSFVEDRRANPADSARRRSTARVPPDERRLCGGDLGRSSAWDETEQRPPAAARMPLVAQSGTLVGTPSAGAGEGDKDSVTGMRLGSGRPIGAARVHLAYGTRTKPVIEPPPVFVASSVAPTLTPWPTMPE